MRKFLLALALISGLSGTVTTAQAKSAKWTSGTPKAIRGAWYAKPGSQQRGAGTKAPNNAMILTNKWLYVMYDYGTHDYGGNHLAYQKVGHQYRLRAYDRLEKSWSYTKVQRKGKTLSLKKYATERAGKRIKYHAGNTYKLRYNAKMSSNLSAR